MEHIVDSQRAFFNTHTTQNISFRIAQLQKFKKLLKDNEEQLYKAVYADFKKSAYETYASELGHVYNEINLACRQMKRWTSYKRAKTNLINLPGRSYTVPVPLGVVLVIGTWNFPYMLSLVPSISALAAGNTVILKPSEVAGNTSHTVAQLINNNFEPRYFTVVEGGIPETTELLTRKFDKIFFTGSSKVGKIVYQAAAKNMTPVTLELGGKNPVIFTEKCRLKTGVKRLIWAKFLNGGQSCVAPDYVMVHRSVKENFLKLAAAEIEKSRFLYDTDNYVQIVSESRTRRLIELMDGAKVYCGGRYELAKKHIEPTLLTEVNFDDKIMQEEIFGPILPVLVYDDLDRVIAQINAKPRPVASYVYTIDKSIKRRVLHELASGTGAVNDSTMHFINSYLPFGGFGDSGIGSYHGEHGFKTFTHYKSILDKPARFETALKYYPHTKFKQKLIKRLLE
jgi:aldehyde dehydrogenase (NAD+)